MVVVPKKLGDVPICVDLMPLNKSYKKFMTPWPNSVEHVSSQNLMLTVGFGKSLSHSHHVYLLPLSPTQVATV